jgi:threonine/homoserine/homoserine lactone efflux protein
MTGIVLLAGVALLWFIYVTLGVFVAFGGRDRAPDVLVRLFDPAYRTANSSIRRAGVALGAGVSLVIALLPEIALLGYTMSGRSTALENAAISLSLIACAGWLAFMAWRYRPSTGPRDGSTSV